MKRVILLSVVLCCTLAFANNQKVNCKKPTPKPPVISVPPTKVPTPVSVSTGSTSASTSGASSTSSATGGNSTSNAAGGNATGGSSTISGSGNSTNNNTAMGGQGGTASQKQGQSQSQSSSNNNQSSASNNGSNVSTSDTTNVVAPKIPVASAYAPTALPTVPCFKGYGGAVQTMAVGGSFGGGKVDQGCDSREQARVYMLMGSRLAACKVLVFNEKNQKLAKKHPEQAVTMDDCMYEPPVATVIEAPQPKPEVIEKTVVVYVEQPHEEMTVTATKAQVRAATKPSIKKHVAGKPCIVPKSLTTPLEK